MTSEHTDTDGHDSGQFLTELITQISPAVGDLLSLLDDEDTYQVGPAHLVLARTPAVALLRALSGAYAALADRVADHAGV